MENEQILVTWELVRVRIAERVSVDDTVAQSAAKLGVTLKEKQQEALSPQTVIMQEQAQRFSESGITSGFIGEAQKGTMQGFKWTIAFGVHKPRKHHLYLLPEYASEITI